MKNIYTETVDREMDNEIKIFKGRTLFLTIGVIGSGKSTWSKEYVEEHPDTLIIDRDSIRNMIYGKYSFIPENEKMIKEMSFQCIKIAFQNGFDVILDNTHLTENKREEFLNYFEQNIFHNFQYYYIYFPKKDSNCVDRRMKESRGYNRETWQKVFDSMVKAIEYPTNEELFNKNCRGVIVPEWND